MVEEGGVCLEGVEEEEGVLGGLVDQVSLLCRELPGGRR